MSNTSLEIGVVITMAGAGSRFAQAGYTVPKYEIVVHGRTLFEWSMESLRSFIDSGSPFTFVTLARNGVEAFIARECQKAGIAKYTVVQLPEITDGQATTALQAQEVWDDPARPLAIYNIDTFVHPKALPVTAIKGIGWIPCFAGEGDKWSFAAADTNGRITEVREKRRISPHATVGLYWFDSFERYSRAYNFHYADPANLEARERYVAPLYNRLIEESPEVYIHNVSPEDVHPLGTPEDVGCFASAAPPELQSLASAL